MLGRLILITLTALASAASAQEQPSGVDIGVTEWINPSAVGQPSGADTARELTHGARIVEKEEVTTNPVGAADFSFYNRSRLLVGPECKITLDHRYYDRELDVEVKDFSVYTNTRCVLKGDNRIASNPRDRIVLKTPLAVIELTGTAAYIQIQTQLASSLKTGPAGHPLEQHLLDVVKIDPGGEVTVGEITLLRAGHMVWIDPSSGDLNGPAPASLSVVLAFQARLEGVVAPPERPTWDGDYILEPLDQADLFQDEPILPPTACISDECEILVRPDEQLVGDGGTGGVD